MIKTIRDLWKQGYEELKFFSRPDLEVRLLLEKAACWDLKDIFLHLNDPCPSDLARRFKRLCLQRKKGYPLALLLGWKEFWSMPFRIKKGVFIPRPETETLVELALQLPWPENGLVADIGTGCGTIACAIAKERPKAKIIATDISRRAIRLAQENARHLHLKNIAFFSGSLFNCLSSHGLGKEFDLIISNPPYVAESEWSSLSLAVRNYEPKRALVAGPTGLEYIFKLIEGAPFFLRPGGFLAFEFGFGQLEAILTFLKKQGWREIQWKEDLAAVPRALAARWG
ncbi:MAG: peptide chain release factor N(5)-glutamine methyltransferase [Candidatus Aminicenantes bacterium]|nr:peptide chain release factor N(5)-glutamine methyltransferase [Candidatus Aminicenantes bacterium]